MNILFDQILENREAAALPSLMESGGLPALISGLGAVHRANLAAALRSRLGLPLVVISPDDTAAEGMARDLAAMLGEEPVTLGLREFTFYESAAVSRQAEQKRLAALWAMAGGALAALDAIELISSGLGERCDAVVGVLASRASRLERIMRRDGISAERAAERIDAQKGEDYFKEKCDHILYNNGDVNQFSDLCKKTFSEVVKSHG